MKTTKNVLTLLLILVASVMNAQSIYENRTTFGILAGVNFQNMTGKDYQGSSLENDVILGFHVGANVQIPIVPEFYFQPGLLFSTKGAKHTASAQTTTYHLSYLELPLNLVYKGALSNGFIFIGFGPYLGYGISGKVSREGGGLSRVESDVQFKNVVDVSDPLTTPYYRALDVGGNVFAGYETAMGLFLQLNAQLGLININPEDRRFPGDKSALKNTGFGLSVGYRF